MRWLSMNGAWPHAAITILGGTGCGNAGATDSTSCGLTSVPAIIGNFIKLGLFIAGLLAVIFLIVGSIQYVTSSGNPQRAQTARSTLLYAILGLLLALFAFAIVNFILKGFGV